MLRSLHDLTENRGSKDYSVAMADASWPVPFRTGLEYNSAAHGTWNIVHTGMLIPDAHQIYVCADNCNRGVVLTAVEMNAGHRFSFITIRPEDLYSGGMEEKVIEGISDILDRLKRKPSVVLLFLVCLHHFMGCDIPYIYESLRKRHPDQLFLECWMDPIMQKEGLTPDQKLRDSMYSCIGKLTEDPRQISFIGSDFSLDAGMEIMKILESGGYKIKDAPSSLTFEDYLSMGKSSLNICTYPPGLYGAKKLSERLGIPLLYLPLSFDYEENDRQLSLLCRTLSLPLPDLAALRARCEEALRKVRSKIGNTSIIIDMSACPAFLGLARLLCSHGFHVECIFADGFSPDEEKDYTWLKQNAGTIRVCPIIHPAARRFRAPASGGKVLAVGQKAAYFYRTPHFVNIVQGGDLHGYGGILKMLSLMEEAFDEEKDTADLVVRKGLGCESCI